MKKIISITILSYVGIILTFFLFGHFMDNNTNKTRIYDNNKEVLSELIDRTYKYSEYTTAEFGELNISIPARAELCGYTQEQQELADKHNMTIPCVLWDKMERAKFDFHRQTVKARIISSDPVVEALNNIENGFFQVFDKVISEDYYLRSIPDNYNLIMTPLFDRLEIVMRKELQ